MQEFTQCPCCSGNSFADCCRDIVAGTTLASTPLALMRSRYTAHVCKEMPHIIRTMRGKALKLFDEEKTHTEWFEQSVWTKLEIVDAPEVQKHDKEGFVEFKAFYNFQGQPLCVHERSKFVKEDGAWYYVLGQQKNPTIASSNKIGRNDVCPCGSGKKYKKCCANTAA